MILDDPQLFSAAGTPRPDPEAHALKTGTAADFPRVPEDVAAINARNLDWYDSLRPQNDYHSWLIDQAVFTSLWIDRNVRIDRRQRDMSALRAKRFWDDDRRLEAEVLGEQLARKPAATVNKLRQTPQGCDWLISRWSALARMAGLDGGWGPDQKNRAFDLLGVRAEERSGEPGDRIDLEGNLVGTSIGHAELAHRQVDELLKRKQEVANVDTLERAMAKADHVDSPTPESKSLRRANAELHRRLKSYLDQVNKQSPYTATKPKVYDHYYRMLPSSETTAPTPPRDESQAQAPTEPSEASTTETTPKPRFPNDEFDENGNTWPYLIKARLDERDREQDARDEARYAKRAARYKKLNERSA
jgi:hypothetical protein